MICLSIYVHFERYYRSSKETSHNWIIRALWLLKRKRCVIAKKEKVCNIQELGHRGKNNVTIRQCHIWLLQVRMWHIIMYIVIEHLSTGQLSCKKWPHWQKSLQKIFYHQKKMIWYSHDNEKGSNSHGLHPLSTDNHQILKVGHVYWV